MGAQKKKKMPQRLQVVRYYADTLWQSVSTGPLASKDNIPSLMPPAGTLVEGFQGAVVKKFVITPYLAATPSVQL